MKNSIKRGWMKWRKVSGDLCEKKVPTRLKIRLYKIVVRPGFFIDRNVGQ